MQESSDPRLLSLPNTPRLRSLILMGGSTAPFFLSQAQFESLSDQSPEESVHESRLRVRLRDMPYVVPRRDYGQPEGLLLTHEPGPQLDRPAATAYALKHEDVFWSPCPFSHLPRFCRCVPSSMWRRFRHHDPLRCGYGTEDAVREKVTGDPSCFVTIMSDLIYHRFPADRPVAHHPDNSNFAVQPQRLAAQCCGLTCGYLRRYVRMTRPRGP